MATIYSNNETININPTDDLVLYKEEFINSRIEKFLYAICALDFDDLPTPLSRIEELYKCLATGLPAPTFVPQSRVEKYLMAILGSYDASDLPVPQSRTEVLLNKILMGDTDLSNIEWLKSRYEFLLAYIAKGGKIDSGSGNDFEYLRYIFSSSTYSIDRTKELPVKSAILKGDSESPVDRFEIGTYSAYDGTELPKEYNETRLRTKNTYSGAVGEFDFSVCDGYKLLLQIGNITYESSNNSGWVQSLKYTTTTDVLFGVVIKKDDESTLTLDDIKNSCFQTNYPILGELISVKMPVLTTSNEDGTKSTTVTCNEEVELRGIGDVKDELDLVTGELTRRVAKIVLDGSEESIFLDTTKEITQVFKIVIDNSLFLIGYDTIFISDSLPNGGSGDVEKFVANIFSSSSTIYVALNKTKASTIPEFREYLSKNPLTILGPAKNQTIETVNPATKDQDGNEAKLSSFEDITHVTVTSEGILPDVELSVAKYYPYLTFLLESVSMDTLYNTKELPVKSAILKGNTLVNLTCHDRRITNVSDVNLTEGRLTWTTNADWQRVYFVVNGKPNTKYIIKYQSIHENVEIYYRLDTTNINQSGAERIYNSNQTITSGNTGTFIISLERATASSDSWVQDFMIIEYQDGMENWDIPYFEGIGSVKMPVLTTSNGDGTKTNILTANEEVELRGIGEVQDELNCLTGEVTQRIGEMVLDGNEYWEFHYQNNTNTIAFRTPVTGNLANTTVMCDKFVNVLDESDTEHCFMGKSNFALFINRSRLSSVDSTGLKQYLKQNPITLQYKLATESVKTVDLSVINQDGNEVKLSSFEDITHVTVTSEGILPDVELSIANQFEEDLTTLSLRMNNIATTQEELGESVNEQTTEVDSTMMATTEIYEGLL